MCGICGVVYNDHTYQVDISKIVVMRDSMTHRGPDDAGNYISSGVALGSRRLAILDLSDRGHMPMSTPDGRYQIVYNGEVYNYREIRSPLESRGYTFRSNTDTEVILNLYADQGPTMLNRLNGMFAFAIWDEKDRTLFLARDRLGVKPLYYMSRQNALYFASEEKALFAGEEGPQFDPTVWEELLCFRFVAGEQTPFIGIKRLLPGHYLIWKNGDIQIRRWWNLGERAQTIRENLPRDNYQWFRETFDSAVNLRRISDVPVGVLLSGGLDSGSVAASLASQAGSDIASFTVRFAKPGYDEGPLAKQVAERWQMKFHGLEVSDWELLSLLKTASWFNDEPLAHANDLFLLAIAQYAKPRVTVLLSGEGGDETQGGYVRYQPLRYPSLLNAARAFLPKIVSTLDFNGRTQKLSRFLRLGSIDQFVLFNASEILPEDLKKLGMDARNFFPYRESVLEEAKTVYPNDPFRQAMYNDHHTFLCSILDRNDRMTMGASIECRVPFLDYRLIEMLAALPTSAILAGWKSKSILRRSVGARLPLSVLDHRKWGFGVPWVYYFRQNKEFRDFIQDLPNIRIIKEGPFHPTIIKNLIDAFQNGGDTNEPLIRQLVMIAVWQQAYLDKESQSTFRSSAQHG